MIIKTKAGKYKVLSDRGAFNTAPKEIGTFSTEEEAKRRDDQFNGHRQKTKAGTHHKLESTNK